MVAIISTPELHINQPARAPGTDQINALHERVVSRNVANKQIQISGGEYQSEHELRLARDAGAGSSFPDFCEEDEDGRQVTEVTGQPEQVHAVFESFAFEAFHDGANGELFFVRLVEFVSLVLFCQSKIFC